MTVKVYNLTRQKVSVGEIKKAVEDVLRQNGKAGAEVNVILVGEKRIQNLNRLYRDKDEVTDVLSFEVGEGNWPQAPDDKDFLGEVFICLAWAGRQAKELGHSRKKELADLTAHGVLHLLGWTHRQMEEKGWGI